MTTSFNFDELEFADNADYRCPVVLVLDCSDSMAEPRPGESRTPLQALNSGLDTLISTLHKDPLAKRRVELSVVAFGTNPSPATDFATVENLVLPTLATAGLTNIGGAVEVAIDALEARKQTYKANGIQYFRPWCILITDGLTTSSLDAAKARIADAEARKQLSFFAVGVDAADMESLAELSVRQPLKLRGLAFEQLFTWLSASQAAVSASTPGDMVALPTPAGWAEV